MIYLDMRGAKMPALGFGTWMLQGDTCMKATRTALSIGYRHIDTAQIYENEAEVGKAIVDSGIPRNELFVTTKLWITNFIPDRVHGSFQESLNKLQMEYVDLLLIHWPNPEVPMKDTLGAMQALQAKGVVRAIGVSNFPVKAMREAVETCGAPVACNQVEYHAMLSQHAVLDYARAHGIIVTAYSPLGRGKILTNPVLVNIAARHGKTPGQVALRWLVQQEGVAAIPKAASEANARANFNIFDFMLSESEMAAIDAMDKNNRRVNPDFAPEWDAA